MSYLDKSIARLHKRLDGDGSMERQILLFKLSQALENTPDFSDKPNFDVMAPQRQWLSTVGALLSRVSIERKIEYKASYTTLAQYWTPAIKQILGQVADAIEEIKLELELDGRSDIGNAYAPGDVYSFFSDLKEIINSAQKKVMVVDPYFDGKSFEAYLSAAPSGIKIDILADRYSTDIKSYVDKHKAQYQTNIELRSSDELHDRLVFVDDSQVWIIGGSIKDAANKKPTYLIPLAPQVADKKKVIYDDVWNRSKNI